MSWIIDDIELSTLAFNVTERSAGWKVPAKRGENLVIPGRNGAQWVPNKPFEVGSIVLSMWAVGALEDGTVPSIGAQKQVRNNLDKLTALFSQSHKLLNVVQISSIAYGIKNFFLNPAFSASQGNSPANYQNFILNPAPRKRVDGVQLTNMFPNPSFNTLLAGTDPTRTNYAPTPHFGYGLGAVVAGPNAILGTVTDPDFDHDALSITPDGVSNDSSAYPLGTPVGTMARMGWIVGNRYTVSATFKPTTVISGTLAPDALRITLAVVRAGVTTLAEFTSTQALNTANTSTRLIMSFIVPQDADDCYVRLVNGSSNASDVVLVNNIMVENNTQVPLGYFDGDTPSASDSTYSWVGTPGNSASILVYSKSKLNVPIGYGNLQGGYTLSDKSWDTRIPKQIALLRSMNIGIFFPVELHEENDMHKYFLTQLRAVDADWSLSEGDGGNMCLYRPSLYTITNVINFPFKASRRMSIFTVKELASGFTFNVLLTHFRADDNDGTSRADERAAEAKELIAWIVANDPINLTFMGDFNSSSLSSGYPRDTFKKAGWLTMKERGPVVDGQYSTYKGTLNGDWIEDIYTKLDVGVSNSVLVKTNGASDHFAWLKTTYSYDINVSLGFSKTHENVFVDPYAKWPRVLPKQNVAYNYFWPANYEGYSIGGSIAASRWVDGSNVDSVIIAPTAADKLNNPDLGAKIHQIRATSSLGANATIGSRPPIPFNSTDKPFYRVKMRRYNNSTASRSIQIRLQTCKSDGTVGSSGSWQTFALPSGNTTWIDVAYNSASMPSATSTYNNVTFQYRTNESWSSGDGIVIDNHMVNGYHPRLRRTTGFFSNFASPFWNADSPWLNVGYSVDTSSSSSWTVQSDTRWTVSEPTAANSAYYAFVQTPIQDPNGTTFSFHAFGFQVGGTQQFTIPCAAVGYPGRAYALRFRARAMNGAACKAELLKQGTSDSAPVSVGSVDFVGEAVSANVGFGFSSGAYKQIAGPSYIPASGDKLFVRFTVPVATTGLPVMQTSMVGVQTSSYEYTGDSASTINSLFTWDGERYNSKTVEYNHRAKRVSSNLPVAQRVLASGSSNTNFLEIQCISPLENSGVVLEAQPLIPASGYYFGAQILSQVNTDGIALGNSVVKGRVSMEFLDSSNAVVATYTGDPVVASPRSTTSTPYQTAYVQAPLLSIPSSAVAVRPKISMDSPLKGTSLLINKVVLLNTPVSASHLGRVAMFSGSSGVGYSWLGNADDSPSIYTGGLLTRWSSPNGGQIISNMEAAFKGGPAPDGKPELAINTAVNYLSAGRYLYGFRIAARNEDSAVNSYIPGRVTLKIQFLNSGTVINTFDVTTLYGVLSPSNNVQGMFDVTGSFNEIRLLFKSSVAAPVLYVKIKDSYLYADTFSIPVQHLNTNKVFNPGFYNIADQWNVSGILTDITFDSDADRSIGLSSDAQLVSNRFAVTAGTSLRFATWARNNVTAQIKFYNSSSAVVSSSTPVIITQSDYNEIQASLIAVPSGAVTAEVVYATAAGNAAELRYSYVGVNYSSHEDDGFYNPMDYPYFDGSVPDFYSSPATWTGDQDDSVSAVIPSIPSGWVYTPGDGVANVNQVIPAKRPPGSSGLVGGLVKAPKGSTRTFRTVGVYRTSNNYLSGQIAVSALPGATVNVSIYQATSPTASGSLLMSRNLTKTSGQIFVWNDLPLFNDYVYLQITYNESQNTSGYRVWMDNLSFVMTQTPLDGSYPGYFDGNQGGGGWSGEVDNSISIYYGGGRRAYAEVKEAIDMSSMAAGTRAEFAVSLEIPGSFWEDLVTSTLTFNVTNGQLLSGERFDLEGLAGGTAPIDDAVLEFSVKGNVSDLMITDVATGGWLKINGPVPARFTIDNGNFTVLDSAGNSMIAKVTRGGSNQLVPIVPVSSTKPPALTVSSSADSTGSCDLVVIARRRYVIA